MATNLSFCVSCWVFLYVGATFKATVYPLSMTIHLLFSFYQPNPSAQAAFWISSSANPTTSCSGPNTRTTHEPPGFLWGSTQPFSCLRCTANPLTPRSTHERVQQHPGSLRRTSTDPQSTSSHPTRCPQVWLPLIDVTFFFPFVVLSDCPFVLTSPFLSFSLGLFWFLHCLFVSPSHSWFCISLLIAAEDPLVLLLTGPPLSALLSPPC